MKRMVIVGTVSGSAYKPTPDVLRLYRLDTKDIKDIKDSDLAPFAAKLGVINFDDLQIPEVRELYPMYYRGANTKLVQGAEACFVLGTFGAGGYVCIRPHVANDYIQVIPRSRLVADVKKGSLRLLNAVIEQGSSADIISPIKGIWEDMSYLKGRKLVDSPESEDDCECGHQQDKRDKIGAEEAVDSHDELGMLNAAQKEFLKNYYIEYSIETFNKLVGKANWTLKQDHEITEKNNKKRESKLARLATLRTLSNGEAWRFAGLWDVGYISSRDVHKCEFGHNLRYIYMACPVGKDATLALQDGTLLKFGIVCHAEFLNIPPEEAARLGKLLNTMCSEITFMSTVVANVAVDKHTSLMSSMHDLLGLLDKTAKLTEVVGDRLAKAYKGFVSNNLPLVESVVLDIISKFEAYGTVRVLSAAGLDTSMFAPKPTDLYVLPELALNSPDRDIRQYPIHVTNAHIRGLNALYRTHEAYYTVLTTYADKLLTQDIAGEYMYNPLCCLTDYVKGKSLNYQRYSADEVLPKCSYDLRKYRFGYNADTRELRDRWMRYFANNTFDKEYLIAPNSAKVRCLTLQGLVRFIELATRLTSAGLYMSKVLGASTVAKLMDEFTNVYSYNSSEVPEAYRTLHIPLLLTALPFAVNTGCDTQARRVASSMLMKTSSKVLFDSLDATKEGTDPTYLAELKDLFLIPVLDSSSRQLLTKFTTKVGLQVKACDAAATQVVSTTPVALLETARKSLTDYLTKCNTAVIDLGILLDSTGKNPEVREAKEEALKSVAYIKTHLNNVETYLRQADTQPKGGSTNSYRSVSVVESEKLAAEFTELYASLPKSVTAEPTIQIAVDIIKRFSTKFKASEGFTPKEKWRVGQELGRLNRLVAQHTK